MKNKKLLAILLVAVLVLSACGTSDNKEKENEKDSSKVEDNDNSVNTDEDEDTNSDVDTEDNSDEDDTVAVEMDKDAPNAAQEALLQNEATAEQRDGAFVTIDKIAYTVTLDDVDQAGATNAHMTFTNNGTYPVVDYTVKVKVGNLDVQFNSEEAVLPGTTSTEIVEFIRNAEKVNDFAPTFYSYSVRVSDTEGYTVRYDVKNNEYSVTALTSYQLADVNDKVNAAK